MITRKLLELKIKFIISTVLGGWMWIYISIQGFFIESAKIDYIEVLKDVDEELRDDKDLGFFFIVENMSEELIRKNWLLRFLILRKFFKYISKALYRDLKEGNLWN